MKPRLTKNNFVEVGQKLYTWYGRFVTGGVEAYTVTESVVIQVYANGRFTVTDPYSPKDTGNSFGCAPEMIGVSFFYTKEECERATFLRSLKRGK